MALDIKQSKEDLAELIKRRLGEPVVKVELETQQIYDAINYAKQKWVKWGAGNSLVETYFTVLLLAGQNFYDLPIGVVDIVDYIDDGRGYGVNTLFTLENFLYNQGTYNFVWGSQGIYGNSILNYHIALDYLETVSLYTPTIYNYKYHRYSNQLEVHPVPPSGNSESVIAYDDNGNEVAVDSPGYILVRSYMIEGSHYADMETDMSKSSWKRQGLYSSDSDEFFFTSDWIFDYALAECKIILGRIRSKFAQFNSIGNIGIALDGDQLIQEGIQEKTELDEKLRLEESHEGYGILLG